MHVVGWIFCVFAVVIAAALCLPFAVKVEYLQTWRVVLKLFGFLPIYTYAPTVEKSAEQEATETAQTPPAKDKAKKTSLKDELKTMYREGGVSGILDFFSQVVRLLTTTLVKLVRHVSVRKLALCIRVGTDEADKTATTCGAICAALYPTLTALENVVPVHRRAVVVQPDFLADTTVVRLRTVFWIWPLGTLAVGIGAFFKAVGLWMKASPSASKTQHKGRTS